MSAITLKRKSLAFFWTYFFSQACKCVEGRDSFSEGGSLLLSLGSWDQPQVIRLASTWHAESSHLATPNYYISAICSVCFWVVCLICIWSRQEPFRKDLRNPSHRNPSHRSSISCMAVAFSGVRMSEKKHESWIRSWTHYRKTGGREEIRDLKAGCSRQNPGLTKWRLSPSPLQ